MCLQLRKESKATCSHLDPYHVGRLKSQWFSPSTRTTLKVIHLCACVWTLFSITQVGEQMSQLHKMWGINLWNIWHQQLIILPWKLHGPL